MIVHAEATTHLHRTLHRIRELGARSGVALNPHTPVSIVENVLDETDMVLAMTVNPGFGGQTYIQAVEAKVRRLRAMVEESGLSIEIEVDGGITNTTIGGAARPAPTCSSPGAGCTPSPRGRPPGCSCCASSRGPPRSPSPSTEGWPEMTSAITTDIVPGTVD